MEPEAASSAVDAPFWLPEPFAHFSAIEVGIFQVGDLIVSFGIILLTLLLRRFLTRVLFTRLRSLAERTRFEHDDRLLAALEKPTEILILVIGIFLSFVALPVSSEWETLAWSLFRGTSLFIVFWGLLRAVDVIVDAMALGLKVRGTESALAGFAPLIKKTARIFLIVVAVVMVVDNLGYDIGGILAALGVGGLAFAIAAKDTVANLYGSLALLLDRPFKVGDWIQVGNTIDGDVEAIGLRSTKVRTWPKTLITIPNAWLANETINNWSRMPKRRIKQVIGVAYGTSPDTMTAIVEDIREILRNDEGVNQEFILVNWTDFGASSLDILVYYFSSSIKWVDNMNLRERVNAKIANVISARGATVAVPARSLYLEGEVARKLAGGRALPDDVGPALPY